MGGAVGKLLDNPDTNELQSKLVRLNEMINTLYKDNTSLKVNNAALQKENKKVRKVLNITMTSHELAKQFVAENNTTWLEDKFEVVRITEYQEFLMSKYNDGSLTTMATDELATRGNHSMQNKPKGEKKG